MTTGRTPRPTYREWLGGVDYLLRRHLRSSVNDLVAIGYDFRADYDRKLTPSLSSAYAALWKEQH